KINFDENVKAKGINLVDKIQHGIKISLIKDKKKNDINGRYYFFLADSDENSFQFQNYAPSYFHKIRSLYGINENKYLDAICNKELLGGEKNNAGKSGQIFWRTQNQEFVIKTVTQKEATFLQSNLKIYIEHLENNPHSLISRFFGLHKIKVDRLRLRFVVMNNVFSTCKIPPQLIYDLKGTTEDRLVKQSSKLKKQPILKDLNFADRFILVSKQMSKSLLFQIKNDVNFFLKVGVMDYSLLLGVCVKNEENSEVLSVDTEIDVFAPLKYNQHFASSHISKASVFESGIKGPLGETYFLGIIDFLQEWTKKKKMANVFKTCAFCDCQQNKIDSVPPVKYAERFQEYLDSKIKNTRSLGSYSMGLDKIQNRILINCNSAYDLFVVDSAFSAFLNYSEKILMSKRQIYKK
ncbi:Phosphatidylinositol-4-phosphate 5-kinase, partial [Bonamia ostreae]